MLAKRHSVLRSTAPRAAKARTQGPTLNVSETSDKLAIDRHAHLTSCAGAPCALGLRMRFLICICLAACAAPHDHGDAAGHEHDLSTLVPLTHRAVKNGGWDEPSTWSNDKVPGDGAGVLIPIDTHVVLRTQETARIALVVVRGTLRFQEDVSTRLSVETLQVLATGALRIGTTEAPVARARTAEIVFIDTGNVAPVEADQDAVRRGLVASGEVTLFGAAKTPFATASSKLVAGARHVTLDAPPTGWRVGDTVVVPSTQFRKDDSNQNELRTIASIAGNVIELDRPLAFRHRLDPSMMLHVANLTRNIVLRSENADIDRPRRGHVMLMDCGASAVENVLFADLGRTDKRRVLDDPRVDGNGELIAGSGTNPRGRYPLHVHKCGLAAPELVVRGSVAHGSPGWSMVNHGSRVQFVDNVAYDFVGAGFIAEDGNELGSFVRNFAANGSGVGRFDLRRVYVQDRDRMGEADFAFHGDGFWFQSPQVIVRDNVAAGCKGAGFFFHAQGLNKDGGVGFPAEHLSRPVDAIRRWAAGSGYAGLLVVDLPIEQFSGNTAYGNFIGLKLRYLQNRNSLGLRIWGKQARGDETYLTSRIDAPPAIEYSPYVIEGSQLWNNFVGVHSSYTALGRFRQTFIGADDVVPTTDINEMWVGWESSHGSAKSLAVDGLTVKGYPIGVLLNPDVTPQHTIDNYDYVGAGKDIDYVAADGDVRI
jgi:hypothetical protein